MKATIERQLRIGLAASHLASGTAAARYTAAIARELSQDHRVTLLASERLELSPLSDLLHADLTKTRRRLIPSGALEMSRASADYDVFVGGGPTASFCRARHGLLLCCSPSPDPADKRLWRGLVRRRLQDEGTPWSWTKGLHKSSTIRSVPTRWTNGDATISFWCAPSQPVTIELVFGRFQPRPVGTIRVRVETDSGELLDEFRVRPLRGADDTSLFSVHRVVLAEPRQDARVVLRLRSPTFVPSKLLGTNDGRELGVAFVQARVLSGKVTPDVDARSVAIATSYSRLVSPSHVIAQSTRREFGTTSAVVRPIPPLVSEARSGGPRIVALGPIRGSQEDSDALHHLELVAAFRTLVQSGHADGWSLGIVGDVTRASKGALREVRDAAAGLPVTVHETLDQRERAVLIDGASLVWTSVHASGSPDAVGEFALEAMARGRAPLVRSSDVATEILAGHECGHLYDSRDELVDLSSTLMANPARRESSDRAGLRRAGELAQAEGGDRLAALIAEVLEDRAPLSAAASRSGATRS